MLCLGDEHRGDATEQVPEEKCDGKRGEADRGRLYVHSGSDPTQCSGFELHGPAVGAVGDPLGWSASESAALRGTDGG